MNVGMKFYGGKFDDIIQTMVLTFELVLERVRDSGPDCFNGQPLLLFAHAVGYAERGRRCGDDATKFVLEMVRGGDSIKTVYELGWRAVPLLGNISFVLFK